MRRGANIHPADLEAALAGLPGVRKGGVAVFAAAGPTSGSEMLVALVGTRSRLRAGQWLTRRAEIVIEVGEPIVVAEHDWAAAPALRDAARRAILAPVQEPDSGFGAEGTRRWPPEEAAGRLRGPWFWPSARRCTIFRKRKLPMSPTRTPFMQRLARLVACAAIAASMPAFAHHGWSWAEDGNSELTGVIVAAKLGNPHGELTLDVSGVNWIVEVGQPWRNERAGLKDEMLVKGVKLTVRAIVTPIRRRRCSRPSAFSSTARSSISIPIATECARCRAAR